MYRLSTGYSSRISPVISNPLREVSSSSASARCGDLSVFPPIKGAQIDPFRQKEIIPFLRNTLSQLHFLFPALPIPKNKKHGMKQIINTISHILRRKTGSEILIPYTAYFVFMPFLQPFYGKINLLIPRYILIQPQTISVGTTYQTIKIFSVPLYF